jgi:hypothetical protein
VACEAVPDFPAGFVREHTTQLFASLIGIGTVKIGRQTWRSCAAGGGAQSLGADGVRGLCGKGAPVAHCSCGGASDSGRMARSMVDVEDEALAALSKLAALSESELSTGCTGPIFLCGLV